MAAGAGALVGLADLSNEARIGIGAIAALLTASIDFGLVGVDLPIFKRQVNDAWLRRYRSWVYGAGFGWQIGVGVATYIMTAGVFLVIALAVLTTSPWQAIAIGATFGLVRGSAVYLGRNATTPAALGKVHERHRRGRPPGPRPGRLGADRCRRRPRRRGLEPAGRARGVRRRPGGVEGRPHGRPGGRPGRPHRLTRAATGARPRRALDR